MTITEYKKRYIKLNSFIKLNEIINIFDKSIADKLYKKIEQYNIIYRYGNYIVDMVTGEIMIIIVKDVPIDINGFLPNLKTDCFNLVYNTQFPKRYGTILELYSIDNVIIYYKYHTRGKLKTIKHYSNMSIYTNIEDTKKREWKLKYIEEKI